MTDHSTYNSVFIPSDKRRKETTTNYTSSITTIDGIITIIEIELQACSKFKTNIEKGILYILPVIGNCILEKEKNKTVTVHSEQLFSQNLNEHFQPVIIHNESDTSIKVLLIVAEHHTNSLQTSQGLFEIDFQKKNTWALIEHMEHIKIGVFDSRVKSEIRYASEKQLIAYSINGTFEFENRLLHQSDCLYLAAMTNVEMEALTEFAIILIIEQDGCQ